MPTMKDAGFPFDAGRFAKRLFGKLGSVGGHQSAARVEILFSALQGKIKNLSIIDSYIIEKIKQR
jgi:hypothetical protein